MSLLCTKKCRGMVSEIRSDRRNRQKLCPHFRFHLEGMKRAAQEAPSDYFDPFSSLTLPTHNDLLKVLHDLEI